MNSVNQFTVMPLAPELVERVLARLDFAIRPEPTLVNLRALYAAWCQRVPFDNLRKIIHLRTGASGCFPGSTPEDFFNAWLLHGTGGTCWSGAGALQALLAALGFAAERGLGTMLAAPDLPPNHGTVRVQCAGADYLLDSSMLCGEPLLLNPTQPTGVDHPAWGNRCVFRDGHWYIAWRPLHKPEGFECRLEKFGLSAEEYRERYEATRAWSPFNYEFTARINRGNQVIGVAFGQLVVLAADGSVQQRPATLEDRQRLLIEEMGYSEEFVRQLPPEQPTPPPPWSRTAQAAGSTPETTRRKPRSAYDQVGGLYYVPRMLDKIRLFARGELHPDYHPNLGRNADSWCCHYLKVNYAELRTRVLAGGDDAEILEWCYIQARRLNEHDVWVWNQCISRVGWRDAASARLEVVKAQSGLAHRTDIVTMMDYFDVDEGRKP